MQTSPTPSPQPTVISSDDYKREYREGMSRLAAAVNIVTTDGAGGLAGFAATAVCSVTDSPPTLLVCLNRTSSAYKAVTENGVLCVNTVSSAHEPLCQLFGGKTPISERFQASDWTTLETGAPVLPSSLCSFDCRIVATHDGGTHDILVCAVVAVVKNEDGRPLVYHNRVYHTL
jgi:flavin reductase